MKTRKISLRMCLGCNEHKEKRELILNVEKILTALNYAKQLFDEDNSCKDLISLSLRQINSISKFGDNYEELSSRLENFYAEADDISCVLTDMIDELSFDAEEATNIEERLALLKSLFKKYGADEKSVLEFRDQAYEEYSKLENSEETIRTLTNRLDCVNNNIFNLCQQLTTRNGSIIPKMMYIISLEFNTVKTLQISAMKLSLCLSPGGIWMLKITVTAPILVKSMKHQKSEPIQKGGDPANRYDV